MIIGLIIFIGLALVSIGLIIYEANNSVEVDPQEPFIYGDYDEGKDPILRHQQVFCMNCQFSKDGIICTNGDTLADITNERVKQCKKESMFIAK